MNKLYISAFVVFVFCCGEASATTISDSIFVVATAKAENVGTNKDNIAQGFLTEEDEKMGKNVIQLNIPKLFIKFAKIGGETGAVAFIDPFNVKLNSDGPGIKLEKREGAGKISEALPITPFKITFDPIFDRVIQTDILGKDKAFNIGVTKKYSGAIKAEDLLFDLLEKDGSVSDYLGISLVSYSFLLEGAEGFSTDVPSEAQLMNVKTTDKVYYAVTVKSDADPVPEPGSIMLLCAGISALGMWSCRSRKLP